MLGVDVRKRCLLFEVFWLLALILIAKILLQIVIDYRNYLPPNFQSSFLIGREEYFFGLYSFAFYLHIFAGPTSIVLGLFLLLSVKTRFDTRHRVLGRIQFLVVMLGVVPSGLVMSIWAYTGMVAGIGFAAHGIATATTMLLAVKFARENQIQKHQQFANRCLILLIAPIFLRINSSVMSVTGLESEFSYQLSAWLCWVIPLVAYQLCLNRIVSIGPHVQPSILEKGETYAYGK